MAKYYIISPTMEKLYKKININLDHLATYSTQWIGSISSVIIHTILFILAFVLCFFGVNFDKILLVVTTIVSLEAIYLAIFIQMSVNKQGRRLGEVAIDIDEIQEDMEGIEKDIDEIQEDIEEDVKEEEEEDIMLERIKDSLGKLMVDIAELKKQRLDSSVPKK